MKFNSQNFVNACVYSVNGREYIAVPAGSGVAHPKGQAKIGVPPVEVHNQFVVFALPEKSEVNVATTK